MSHPDPKDRAGYVRDVFTRIAPRYDLMNRLMTGGQDVSWRQEVIRRAAIPARGRILDLGAGTGDLSREAMRQAPGCRPLAADFTLAMMRAGQRSRGVRIEWAGVDALHLPFPDAAFDAVVSGFLLRNVVDLQQALREQYRVLKPGGRFVALDTTRPRPSLASPFVRLYMRRVIPLLGWLLTGQRDAYTYLPSSTESFVRAEELVARLAAAHFIEIGYRIHNFGTIAIHWGVKSAL